MEEGEVHDEHHARQRILDGERKPSEVLDRWSQEQYESERSLLRHRHKEGRPVEWEGGS